VIYRNRNIAGKRANMVHGLCAIGDGLVRVFSLGFFATEFSLRYAKRMARRNMMKRLAVPVDTNAIGYEAGSPQ
jgi:hypothetical protein